MKILLTSFCFFLLLNCNKQSINQYNFNAEVKGLKDSLKVYLFNYDTYKVIDSTFVKKGTFHFKGPVEYPFSAAIGIPEEELIIQFWVEEGNITLENVDKNKLAAIGMDFSPYVKSQKLSQVIKNYKNQTERYYKNARVANQKLKQGSITIDEYDKIRDSILQKTYNYFLNNPNNYFSLSEMINYKNNYSKQKIEHYFKKLTPELKESPKGIILKKHIELSGVKIGDSAPSIKAKNIENKTVSLSDFKGKYILLNF